MRRFFTLTERLRMNETQTETQQRKLRFKVKPPRDLTVGSIWQELLLFSLPILFCNLFQQLYNTVDAAVVGAWVSSDAIAAVGSTGSLISLLTSFFMGLGAGVGIVVARYRGAADEENLHKSVHTSFALAIICGVFLTAVGIGLSPALLRLMKTPDRVFDSSLLYLRIYFGGMVPIMLYNIGAGVLRAVGDSRRPMWYLFISGIINVIVDVIAVVALNMGVAGVAWATVLSQIVAAVLVIVTLMRENAPWRLRPQKIRIHGHILLQAIKIGIPAGLSGVLYAVSNMLIQTNINVFGPDAMAGNAAFGKIDGFLYMPLNAFGLAATTFVGQNIGARKLDRVKRGAITAVLLGFAVSAAGAVVVFLVSEPLLQIFTKQNAEAVRYGLIAMHYLAPFYCIFSATEVLSGVVRGAGSPLQSTIITAVCICALRVTLVSILQPIFNDIRVVFIAYPISWSVSSITFLLYYRFGKWIKM